MTSSRQRDGTKTTAEVPAIRECLQVALHLMAFVARGVGDTMQRDRKTLPESERRGRGSASLLVPVVLLFVDDLPLKPGAHNFPHFRFLFVRQQGEDFLANGLAVF